jgi:chaperone required for assembly of F1-ATPase
MQFLCSKNCCIEIFKLYPFYSISYKTKYKEKEEKNMNTTLASIAKNTGLALLESTALLLVSTIVGQALRNSTTNASKGLVQAIRFTRSRFQKQAA